MSRFSLGGFRNPVTRPRFIVWATVVIFGIAIFAMAIGFIGTSTKMFCGNAGCHKVQGDTMASYEASPHSAISCMACHEPVNGTPIQFAMAKVKSIGELPPTIANQYRLPLNKGSALALNAKEMGDKQCTQCHTPKRVITPSGGIIINHEKHTKAGVTCTTCHNRTAHNDAAIVLTLAGNVKHEDFLEMDACFRCHDLAGKRRAAGACSTCHPADFKLVPDTHEGAGWLPKGHAEAALESRTKFGEAKAEAEDLIDEGVAANVAVPVEHCSTCHLESFCSDCHAKLAKNLVISKK
jgi:hypothetical protein